MTEKIYNPFNNSMTDTIYSVVLNFSDKDKKIIMYILSTKENKEQKEQLVEFLYRNFYKKGRRLTKDVIRKELDVFVYKYAHNCLNNRLNLFSFSSEEIKDKHLNFWEETLVSARRILLAKENNTKNRRGVYVREREI